MGRRAACGGRRRPRGSPQMPQPRARLSAAESRSGYGTLTLGQGAPVYDFRRRRAALALEIAALHGTAAGGPLGPARKTVVALFGLFRRQPPVRAPGELADFLDAQAAFVTQEGIQEYARAP